MAYTPKIWKDLPDETTPIKAESLNHIEQGLSTLDGSVGNLSSSVGDLSSLNTTAKDSVVDAINEVYKELNYNINETLIGIWMGKKLYRTVLESVQNGINKDTIINLNIKNIKLFTKLEVYYRTDNAYVPIPFTSGTGATLSCRMLTSPQQQILFYGTASYASTGTLVAIIEYTKTTD